MTDNHSGQSAAKSSAGPSRQRFLDACACRPTDRPPVWLMRQAGRALPEYRRLKDRYSFLELVKTPELAAEVTLQPVRRFGFDAAILFSDILVVAEALGQPYDFREGGGIQMAFPVNSIADLDRLDGGRVLEHLRYQALAVRLIKQALDNQAALIGFAGSPWTLINFMVEGGSSHQFKQAIALLKNQPAVFDRLARIVTLAVIQSLSAQIEAGVEVVQIFDTLGGTLEPDLFEHGSARWMREIVSALRGRVPVIVFAKGVNGRLDQLTSIGAQVLGFDASVRLREVRSALPADVAVQGNLDPRLLSGPAEALEAATRQLLTEMRGCRGHILNLGHGVPPDAKLENIMSLVDIVRKFA